MARSAYEKLDAPVDDDLSGSDDEYNEAHAARPSEDARRHDHETLTAEEEAERLLGGSNAAGGLFSRDGQGRKERRRDRRREKRGREAKGEKRELMYEMEEGGPRSSSAESIASSSENDMQRLGEVQSRRKTSRAKRVGGIALIHIVIIAAFLGLLYGAYRATGHTTTRKAGTVPVQTLSNGTHLFAPTTILLSLDGFRADFLNRGLTPTLDRFIKSGVSPRYMKPSFPSLTFPNHFTIVTGLHPESHGVVGNTFWDPTTQKGFTYTDPARSMQPEWWNAEPIWVTAESQDVRTAIHMWPGSEAHIGGLEPEYVDEFNAREVLDRKVQRVLGWLDMPGDDDLRSGKGKAVRPQFIAAYVPNVDADGHKYGPNSTYIRSTISEVDGMLDALFNGIDERNLTKVVNIVIVSDHGMATTSTDRLVQLEDLIDPKLIEHIDGWPLYGLRPYDTSDAKLIEIYNTVLAKSKLPKYKDAFDVYLRDKTMPARYHFSTNPRIAPLWIMPRPGWAVVTKKEFDVAEAKANDEIYHPRGLHGYDHEHPLMRAIFVARGPAFPHAGGSRLHEFQNTEVYNIICDSLGLEPKPNNGTLHLPFRTKGLHDFDAQPEDPHDLPTSHDEHPPEVPNLNNNLPPVTAPKPPVKPDKPERPSKPEAPPPPKRPARPDRPQDNGDERPVVHDEDTEPKTNEGWWAWVKSKMGEIRWWASEKLGWKSEQEQGKEEDGKEVSKTGNADDESGLYQRGG